MKTWILYILIIGLGILCVYQFLNPKSEVKFLESSPDTVYVDKYLKPDTEYKYIQVPKYITQYKVDSVFVEKVEVKHDTFEIYLKDSSILSISSQYLTQYPNNDKLISLLFDDRKLDMNLLNTKGNIYNKQYPINPNLYSYNYVNNNLTFERKKFFKRFSPTAQITVRPFNNLYDLDFGLKYNTSKFNYELGFNSFYYPNLKKGIGTDLYLRLNYTF